MLVTLSGMTVILAGMTHTVGAKGQVVIPKHLRDELKIQPGQEVLFERRGTDIVLRKAGTTPLKGRFAGRGLADALLEARATDKTLETQNPNRTA